jgi:DNA invertase Pin-like site-specific DNA recombinase
MPVSDMQRTPQNHQENSQMNGLEKLCSMVTNRFGKARKQKPNDSNRFVVYYRVSTKQQGESGLGLEAQRAAAEAYVKQRGGEIIGEYQEVETGKNCRRPEIMKAIMHANRSHATLVIAKLDRLSRSLWFTSTLLEAGVDFVACDNPHASKLTLHILASIGEHEAYQISCRTKDALAAYKARGGVLGPATFKDRDGWKPKQEQSRQRATQRNSELAFAAYEEVRPIIQNLRSQGLSFQKIADALNEQGFRTRLTGSEWNRSQVRRVAIQAIVLIADAQ